MPSWDSLLSVTLAGLALSASPGPSMLYVLSRSVGQSRAAGLASALGLCLGGMILAIATAMGLATFFARFSWLVTGLTYVGSAYLIWLGVRMIVTARKESETDFEVRDVGKNRLSSIIWQGILVEVLNPKTVLFFALFLPPFVTMGVDGTDHQSLQIQLLILGVLVPLTAIPSDMFVAFMGGTLTKSLKQNRTLREALACIGGAILIIIAINLQLRVP